MPAPGHNAESIAPGAPKATGFPLIGAVFICLALFIAICLAGVLLFKLLNNEGFAMLFGMLAWAGIAFGTPICLVIAVVVAIFAPNARI